MSIIKDLKTTQVKRSSKKDLHSPFKDLRSPSLGKIIVHIAVLFTVALGGYDLIAAVLEKIINSNIFVTILSNVLTLCLAWFASGSVSKRFKM